jgi:Zn ribbon nucleic-acid-binding protein
MNNTIGNCPLCEAHSLHIAGEQETQTQQCINCGYVTSEKFKLNGVPKEEHESYKNLTEDMKGWCTVENDRMWIPTIMTLPLGMLYPINIDNPVNHQNELKWAYAEMVDIPEEERKDYPIEGQEGKFYERKFNTDNPQVFDIFVEAITLLNEKAKQAQDESKPGIKLPKLKKV